MAAFLIPRLVLCCTPSSQAPSRRRNAAREEFLARPIDKEWEKARRRETRELNLLRKQQEQQEEQRMLGYRRIASRLKDCEEEDVRKAKRLVSNLIKSGEDIEEMVVEAAENGDLNRVVLLVIKARLDIARQDDDRDVVQALDLLFRRIEYEMMKRESTKSMKLLNELLNLNDGSDHQNWLRKARHTMLNTFVPETPFTIAVPMHMHEEEEEQLLRIDFIREVDELIREVEEEMGPQEPLQLDADSVAAGLKRAEKQRNLQSVRELRDMAASLKW